MWLSLETQLNCIAQEIPLQQSLLLKAWCRQPLYQQNKTTLLTSKSRVKCFFEEFVLDRLLHTSTLSMWDSMKKLKRKTYSNWMKKLKLRLATRSLNHVTSMNCLVGFSSSKEADLSFYLSLKRQLASMKCQLFRNQFMVFMVLYIPVNKPVIDAYH
jgi:hypothetical protein